MIDEKIIYKDPGEREISAIIDLTDKSKLNSKSKTGSFKGRNVQQVEEQEASHTTKKLKDISKTMNS